MLRKDHDGERCYRVPALVACLLVAGVDSKDHIHHPNLLVCILLYSFRTNFRDHELILLESFVGIMPCNSPNHVGISLEHRLRRNGRGRLANHDGKSFTTGIRLLQALL